MRREDYEDEDIFKCAAANKKRNGKKNQHHQSSNDSIPSSTTVNDQQQQNLLLLGVDSYANEQSLEPRHQQPIVVNHHHHHQHQQAPILTDFCSTLFGDGSGSRQIFDHSQDQYQRQLHLSNGVKVEINEDEKIVCSNCNDLIFDKHLFKIGGDGDQHRSFYHSQCLKCTVCRNSLVQQSRCYVKGDQHSPHCKSCYQRQFGVKCARCSRSIQPTDWVRRAKQLVYHLACFACDTCKRQLSTGEEFALQDSKLLCKQHYTELFDCENSKGQLKQKTKRVRTTFTEEQLQILQVSFQQDSNPDGQDLERIANLTGLSKRVTQVWFQNSRARQKKYQGCSSSTSGVIKMTAKNSLSSADGGRPVSEAGSGNDLSMMMYYTEDEDDEDNDNDDYMMIEDESMENDDSASMVCGGGELL